MSSSDRNLEDELAKSGAEHQPPYAWQEQVWRRLEAPYVAPEAPKRSGFALWIVVGMVAVALFAGGGTALYLQSSQADSEHRDRLAFADEVRRMERDMRITDAEIELAQTKIDRAFAELEAAQDEESKQASLAARNQAKMDLKNARDRKQAQLDVVESHAPGGGTLVAMDLQLKKLIEQQEEWAQEVEETQQEIAVFQDLLDQAFAALESAIDAEAREAARAEARELQQQLDHKLARLEELRQSNMERQARAKKVRAKKKEKDLVSKCAQSNDPLCGL